MIGNSSFLYFKRNRQKETDKLSNILSCFLNLSREMRRICRWHDFCISRTSEREKTPIFTKKI